MIVLGELDSFVWGGFESTDRQLVAEILPKGMAFLMGRPGASRVTGVWIPE